MADSESRKLIADVEKAGVAADGAEWLHTACAAVLAYLEAQRADQRRPSCALALPELAGTYDPAPGKPWGGATPLAPRVITVLAVRGQIVRRPESGRLDVIAPAVGIAPLVAGDVRCRRTPMPPAPSWCVPGCGRSARPPSPISSGGSATP